MKLVAPSGRAALGRARPFSLALARTVFDTILRDAAEQAGATVLEGARVEDVVRDGGGVVQGVVARSPGGGRDFHRARVVVGADGLRSVVARRLGLRRASAVGEPRLAFCAHLAGVAGVGEAGEMHVAPRGTGYVGLGPIGGGLTTIALVLPARAAAADPPVTPSRFLDALEAFPALRGRFAESTVAREILATGPFAQGSRRATTDGALLVGDAADFFDPFTGQGIHRALRGAELAAAALLPLLVRESPVTAAALRPYARARWRAFRGAWALERLIGLGVGWPWLAERVIGRLARRPELADLLVGATGSVVPARAALTPLVLARLVC